MFDRANPSRRAAASPSAVALAALAAVAVAATAAATKEAPVSSRNKPSDAELREKLTPDQYYVLREHGTERSCTSPLNSEKRKGTFHCAGCELALYWFERPEPVKKCPFYLSPALLQQYSF